MGFLGHRQPRSASSLGVCHCLDRTFVYVAQTTSSLRFPCLYLPSPGSAVYAPMPSHVCVTFNCHLCFPRLQNPSHLEDRISKAGCGNTRAEEHLLLSQRTWFPSQHPHAELQFQKTLHLCRQCSHSKQTHIHIK